MEIVSIDKEPITLGQVLKLAGITSSGIESKIIIQDGYVFVNNELELRRGRKLYDGDIFTIDDIDYQICLSKN